MYREIGLRLRTLKPYIEQHVEYWMGVLESAGDRGEDVESERQKYEKDAECIAEQYACLERGLGELADEFAEKLASGALRVWGGQGWIELEA